MGPGVFSAPKPLVLSTSARPRESCPLRPFPTIRVAPVTSRDSYACDRPLGFPGERTPRCLTLYEARLELSWETSDLKNPCTRPSILFPDPLPCKLATRKWTQEFRRTYSPFGKAPLCFRDVRVGSEMGWA